MSQTKETKPKLPAALVLHDVDVAAAFGLLADQLTALSGGISMLHDVECEIRVDGNRASLRFRAC